MFVLFATMSKEKVRYSLANVGLINTSGKNVIKITSVGMGAAKSNETR